MSFFPGFPDDLPRFRQDQILTAWFDPRLRAWESVSTLPKDIKTRLNATPWFSFEVQTLQESATAIKALLRLFDGKMIETVLMINSKGDFTACVSSQVGCAMACDFCATGQMGFFRDLTAAEIIDQGRFWRSYLCEHRKGQERLSNIVLMGMGEPLNNYEPVCQAMRSYIEYLEIGKTKITVSTVGVKRGMDMILEDPNWPDVRLAISLHYPIQEKRLEHMPVARQRNLEDLKEWCQKYLQKFGNRKHHLTFEYLVFEGKNDTDADIDALQKFLKGIDRSKINLIPWNPVYPLPYTRATRAKTEQFQYRLEKRGILSTIRKSLGVEIDAGCGQLAVKEELVTLGV